MDENDANLKMSKIAENPQECNFKKSLFICDEHLEKK